MSRSSRRRLAVLYLVVASLLVTLGARVWYVQVASGKAYASLASQDRLRTVVVPSVRGQILDDTGAPLVDSRSSLVVSIDMAQLSTQADGGKAELHRLARLLGTKPRTLRKETRICTRGVTPPCWPGSPYQPIPVAEHVPYRIAVQIMEQQSQYPGVSAQVQPTTNYVQPAATDAAQVIGYLQPISQQQAKQEGLPLTGYAAEDLAGQAGLEGQYDRQLRGIPGKKEVTVNAAGQVTGTLHQTPPKSGDNLVTSINTQLQQDAYTALANAIHKVQAEGNPLANSGAAVVMTTTGRVLAMASYPTYNPAVWTNGLSNREYKTLFTGREPILDRATQGEYHPGSTWKVTTLTAAVANGYSLYSSYDCPAAVNVGGRVFNNDFGNGGMMSLHQALVVSCDTIFYNFGYWMWLRDDRKADTVTSPHAPVQKMQKMELAWGFGHPTGVDLPEDGTGTVPTREWLYYFWKDNAHRGQDWCKYGKEYGSYIQRIEWEDCHYGNVWEPGLAVDAAIGQGYVSVTPLQLARGYAALANGGTLYSPRVGEALLSPQGKVVKRITPPVVGHLPVSKTVLAYIRNALQGVVTSGTAAGAFHGFPLSKVCVAGKTGTAQVAGRLATSVFASFAPCGHPKFVVVVMIPNSGYGADVSAPAVRQIWDSLYGLEGHKAALPGGRIPALPRVNNAGQIVRSSPAPSSTGSKRP
jgi:penicillin-binding protein 2